MLVLSRKKNEKIILKVGSEEIIISVVKIEPTRIKLGVEASQKVSVARGELLGTNQSTPHTP